MTLPDLPDVELLTWSSPVACLWVAATPTAYVGMVEETDEGFVANGSTSEDLGTFRSLSAARRAVYGAWRGPAESATTAQPTAA
ncbi:hypothetical protein P5G50_05685 [Leifsonia sp. F6_8S_P_1B]|uniref:Uncharacterized protein n=1 Tax=Leifsonia williamsii TaxID=3035919 RepID=A0ABT8K8Z9_9MICO|nr:hypothetical protein [Leifsonia williamsii]MDN4613941.1 hypothetical protein [Leifsonia williamsii]